MWPQARRAIVSPAGGKGCRMERVDGRMVGRRKATCVPVITASRVPIQKNAFLPTPYPEAVCPSAKSRSMPSGFKARS